MARIKLSLLLLLLPLTGCVTQQSAPLEGWQSQLYSDHPLVGQIWDSHQDVFLESEELLERTDGARYVLLGEKHDNPDHHALQLHVFEHILNSQDIAAVSFEMMTSEQQPLLGDLATLKQKSLSEINAALQWDNDGWDWRFYGPLVNTAIQANVAINAANISNAEMMQVYGEPTPAEIVGVLDEQTMAALEKDIDESHCGMLPESQFPAMVRVQQARDYAMARSLSSSQGAQVLIAGNYHIRRDLGVPNYLLHAQDGLGADQILSIAFMEVDRESTNPADYLQQFGPAKAYDYIWFTPGISDEDYCASLRAQ